MNKLKAHVTEKREVRIHSELWHTSNCLLEAGQEEREGAVHQFRASLVFRAFYLEAFFELDGTPPRSPLELPGPVEAGGEVGFTE